MAKDKHNMLGNVLSGALKQQGDTEDTIKKRLKILDELKIFIPPLSENEYDLLKYNIQTEGCRDALIIWKNDNDYILVDGHNRHKICEELKIDYRIEVKKFDSIFEVKDWMVSNQLGKRNVTEDAKSYLRGKQYQLEKNKANFKGNQHTKSENSETKKTSEKIAEEHKVSAKTIQRDEKYALALDYLVGNDMGLKWKILNREIIIPKTNVLEATEQTENELQKLRIDLYKGKSNTEENNEDLVIVTKEIKPKNNTNATEIVSKPLENELQKTLKVLMKKPNKETLEVFKKILDKYEKEFITQ
ncbi:MAG: hypothetical protein EAZ85_12450 [Bacteroidetes bacterium]|nr:MAG: hypothetical protein EAZ85_12450 [Bacteroidota bacterium]TAG87200.1 MAG: hypothetical protein EAZ20_11125 [Bacteroidota bacterium]